jgi:hypothetical protein
LISTFNDTTWDLRLDDPALMDYERSWSQGAPTVCLSCHNCLPAWTSHIATAKLTILSQLNGIAAARLQPIHVYRYRGALYAAAG